MRILMLTQTFFPSVGGGIRYKSAIVDHFRDRGHTVDVLAVSPGTKLAVESSPNGAVVRVPQLLRFESTQLAPAYIWLFGQLAPQYDVLHFNFPSPMTELAFLRHARRLKAARKIVTYHADIVSAKRFSGIYNRCVTAPFLERMDAIIVSSPNIADSSPHLARHRTKVHVVPFGVDPRTFEQPDTKPAHDANGLRILFVGRLARYKGVDVLLRAMTAAPGELTIVGEGPLKHQLEELARSLGLSGRARFTGFVSDAELLDLYHAADVLVLPSTDAGEAFGYVLLEAMMCETALISTELGTGTSFVNAHQESGLVVPPSDAAALRAAILELTDPVRLQQFKTGARRRAMEHFTIQRMLAQTEVVYAGVPN